MSRQKMHGLLQMKIKFYKRLQMLIGYVHEVHVITTTFNYIKLLTIEQAFHTEKGKWPLAGGVRYKFLQVDWLSPILGS